MGLSFIRKLQGACVVGISLLLGGLAAVPAWAGEDYILPVPNITIYPGDTIKEAWLVDHDFSSNTSALHGSVVVQRSRIVGKLARRTLLPGMPIPQNAVTEPRAIANGGKVRVEFVQDGLEIVTYATALQPGSVGEVISVRNLDSGLTISGTVQSDGSVRVGGG
jgi:flagellar basal body P-ring formation protein FlgA